MPDTRSSIPKILIVDDEADLRELLSVALVRMGMDVDAAASLAVARTYLAKKSYALVLTDMRLTDGQGIDLVRLVATEYKQTPIAVITAYGSTDNAVAALKAGAFDYVSKPVALDQLRVLVKSALRAREKIEQDAAPDFSSSSLLGASVAIQDLRMQISRLARSMAPIAISGESGSGKELAAREIHRLSPRADKPFIAVNCGAIPESLMEAEFFGYKKGAFTGALEDRDGFFQAAHGGTLLLDEVADLPLPMQVKLLRAIQERRVRKVGATTEEPVDVRLVSATHQHLTECVAEGRFRQDLYYRLNVIELHLPPLRNRKDDLPLLVQAILKRLSNNAAPPVLSDDALATLLNYSFPGNVRELENMLERALAFANNGVIEIADLAIKPLAKVNTAEKNEHVIDLEDATQFTGTASIPGTPSTTGGNSAGNTTDSIDASFHLDQLNGSLPNYLDQMERQIILQALAKTHFNRTRAAQLLGVNFRQLRYRMQRLEIHEGD